MKRVGFTLIETILVVSVVALILAIAIPALSAARKRTKTALCQSNIRQITIRFGDDHELGVVAQDGRACLRLQNTAGSVVLDASESLCQYERAVNLLRLHMPGR